MRQSNERVRGLIGEELAAQFLAAKGFEVIGRNVRYGRGELDIICRDNGVLVFVEVKTRRSFPDGDPVQLISLSQEGKLRYTASGYLQENVKALTPTRFDVVGVLETDCDYRLVYVRDALTG